MLGECDGRVFVRVRFRRKDSVNVIELRVGGGLRVFVSVAVTSDEAVVDGDSETLDDFVWDSEPPLFVAVISLDCESDADAFGPDCVFVAVNLSVSESDAVREALSVATIDLVLDLFC